MQAHTAREEHHHGASLESSTRQERQIPLLKSYSLSGTCEIPTETGTSDDVGTQGPLAGRSISSEKGRFKQNRYAPSKNRPPGAPTHMSCVVSETEHGAVYTEYHLCQCVEHKQLWGQ